MAKVCVVGGCRGASLGVVELAPLKAAECTVGRPLHIGAVLAGVDRSLRDTLTAYALSLGEAFQLRDGLLGLLGDSDGTGKSRPDDLREGRHTTLHPLALRYAAPPHADAPRRAARSAAPT